MHAVILSATRVHREREMMYVVHNISTGAITVLVISNKIITHEAGLNAFFVSKCIKRIFCVTIDKATHTSETKTGFAFLATN